jgi:DNA-binding transcriptional ArsR family regulator
VPAGDLARLVQVPHNTLSTHLGVLTRAGLVIPRKEGRSVFYTADFDGMRALIAYLVQDCCKGHPDICVPLAEATRCPAPSHKEAPHA